MHAQFDPPSTVLNTGKTRNTVKSIDERSIFSLTLRSNCQLLVTMHEPDFHHAFSLHANKALIPCKTWENNNEHKKCKSSHLQFVALGHWSTTKKTNRPLKVLMRALFLFLDWRRRWLFALTNWHIWKFLFNRIAHRMEYYIPGAGVGPYIQTVAVGFLTIIN